MFRFRVWNFNFPPSAFGCPSASAYIYLIHISYPWGCVRIFWCFVYYVEQIVSPERYAVSDSLELAKRRQLWCDNHTRAKAKWWRAWIFAFYANRKFRGRPILSENYMRVLGNDASLRAFLYTGIGVFGGRGCERLGVWIAARRRLLDLVYDPVCCSAEE